MPIELNFDEESGVMRARAWGRIVTSDMTSHPERQIEVAPDDIGILYELLDAREVTGIGTSILNMVAHVPAMLSQLRHFQGVRLAIISEEDWIVGQANQLASLFLRSSVSIRVFRNLEEGEAWLAERKSSAS